MYRTRPKLQRSGLPAADATEPIHHPPVLHSSVPPLALSLLRWVRYRPFRLVLVVISASTLIYPLVRAYYNYELLITDPILEARLYMPLSYLRVKYLQRPARTAKEFIATQENTFVVHMESDEQRLRMFKANNRGFEAFRVFPATRIMPTLRKKQPDKKLRVRVHEAKPKQNLTAEQREQKKEEDEQRIYMELYPQARKMAEKGLYGDAGCYLSHIRLLSRFLVDDGPNAHLDYVFVLEDDVQLRANFVANGTVTAPADADLVFLIDQATKVVPVPFGHHPGEGSIAVYHGKTSTIQDAEHATRVISGYGTFGYVITKHGARTMLGRLRRGKGNDPIDVGMMKLAVNYLKIYLPLSGWPQVRHVGSASSKHKHNKID